jgi:hypothetical protein
MATRDETRRSHAETGIPSQNIVDHGIARARVQTDPFIPRPHAAPSGAGDE